MELLRRLVIPALIILITGLILQPKFVAAQDDCVWENINCTATPGPTATPTGTPPATATLPINDFKPPDFGLPTSIPTFDLPDVPDPLVATPLTAPSPISIDITPISTPMFSSSTITISTPVALSTINSTIDLSYTMPLTLDLSSGVTGTANLSGTGAISGAVGDFSGWLEDDVISYTSYLTGQVAAIQGSGTITVYSAPSWYAPALPRPLADVGWTFEQLTDPTGDTPDFTLTSWSSFFGYISSLPFQFIKSLWQIVAYLGPFGLFLGWLLIMFVIVAAIHFQVFIVKFLITIIRLVVRIAEILGGWIPTGG